MPSFDPAAELEASVTRLAREYSGDESLSPAFDASPKPEMGDFSSNAAMVMAKGLGRPPREIAVDLATRVEAGLAGRIEKVEVAGPGFLNLFLADGWYRESVASLRQGFAGGGIEAVAEPERIMVEFVSANPTGPLTAASGRHAAYGDALSRLLKAVGHQVTNEYYVNDGGAQVRNFAASIAARMTGAEPPENGYHGAYVRDLADRATAAGMNPGDLDQLALTGVEWMLDGVRRSLDRFGVGMDDFFSERSLFEDDLVDRAFERLAAAGHTFEQDGATWLRTTDFGDDKDRVLIRSNGDVTYFGADVAYHVDKIERGFKCLIDVWGADHHGYVARMAAAIQSLEEGRAEFEVQILQMIHLVEAGERTKMSKRAGDIVTLDELIDDIGGDATRFFLLQRSHDRSFDLDLDLARSQSADNPVYYVQYAHARIQSILRKAAALGRRPEAVVTESKLETSEKALIRLLGRFSAEVHEAADRRAPHRICSYSTEVAAAFHAFYRDCQVIDAEGEGVEAARLALCELTATTIRSSLGLLGISAPDRM